MPKAVALAIPDSRIPVVQQIPHAVAEFLAARLEVGLRAPGGAFDVAAGAGAIDQARGGIEHVPHLFGVIGPVGGRMQAAALAQLAYQQLRERRLDQAALVVPLLVPWIGEIDTHFVQRTVGDLVFQHFHRIVVIQAHMGAAVFLQRVEQAAYAGGMHLDADVIAAWVLLRGKAQRSAIAEADFQHLVRIASEGGSQIAWRTEVIQPETWP